ncbi:uncharacterized protein TRUGW13939_05943 [Talaromyces rugulosus]|uniref:Uncharacterized protein n=1 Tax=Talaromyces rugulosus TaxID=121627 RepID=A0A7H8QYG3_TALRU|nr:uncharacterized protein TRUGW13939_05943 [Talaromyces rugulosus]QKX58816.1 hypothetical protein TRUGW13939_05943 [Talaromyces rugulosus]
MSATGRAYRHSLRQAPSRPEFIWIGDDLLSSTFRRFVNGQQRRYESRVPGPLEARKRLARRRNTALATSGQPLDIPANVANLFGANGSGHVRQWDDSSWSPRWPEPLELFSYSNPPPAPQVPSFLDNADVWSEPQVPDLPAFNIPLEREKITQKTKKTKAKTPDPQTFEASLARCSTVEDVRKALEWHQIDIRKVPEHSRLILNHFCHVTFRIGKDSRIYDLIEFLNDTSLNVSGVGNYRALFSYIDDAEMHVAYREMLIDQTTTAIQLGLVPIAEVNEIIQCLPQVVETPDRPFKFQQVEELSYLYYRIWESLRASKVFTLYEIYHEILDPWLGQLLDLDDERYLCLARDITAAYYASVRSFADSISARALKLLTTGKAPVDTEFLESWLDRCFVLGDSRSLQLANEAIIAYHSTERRLSEFVTNQLLKFLTLPGELAGHKQKTAEAIRSLMQQLDGDLATRYIVYITEKLVFSIPDDSLRSRTLVIWKHCLKYMNNQTAFSLPVLSETPKAAHWKGSPGLRIALRLWIWSALRSPIDPATANNPRVEQLKQNDKTAITLLKLFDGFTTVTRSPWWNRTEILPRLIYNLQKLNVPCNDTLMKTHALLTGIQITRGATLHAFRKLEEGKISLKDAALHRDTFNATKVYLLSSYLPYIQDVDITSPEFVEAMLQSIEQGRESIEAIFTLMSFHTPLKIGLAIANTPQGRYGHQQKPYKRLVLRNHPKRKANEPKLALDPQACVAFVELMATCIATSEKLTPRAAFNLVTHLYAFTIHHFGPVRPSLVRALYHCGVTRFRQNGQGVSRVQEAYIMGLVRRFEDPQAVKGLMNGSFIKIGDHGV